MFDVYQHCTSYWCLLDINTVWETQKPIAYMKDYSCIRLYVGFGIRMSTWKIDIFALETIFHLVD